MNFTYTLTKDEIREQKCLWWPMNFTYTLTKDEIRGFRHIFHAALSAGAVVELTLPGVGSEAFSNSDQLDDWLCDDDDNPYAEYEVRNLVKEPACL